MEEEKIFFIKGYQEKEKECWCNKIIMMLDDAKWYETKDGYAKSNKYGLMHRYVMGFRKGDGLSHRYVDHIDGNRLNNVKNNLRVVTAKENAKNKSSDPVLAENDKHKSLVGVVWSEEENLFFTVHKKKVYYKNRSPLVCALCYDSIMNFVYGKGKRINDNHSSEPLKIEHWNMDEEKMKDLVILKDRYTDYLGVKWCKEGWKSQIVVDLGTFKTREDAARAYDRALRKIKEDSELEHYHFNFP